MSQGKFCKSCGKQISGTGKFCRNCGAVVSGGSERTRPNAREATEVKIPVATRPAPESGQPAPEPSGKQKMLVPALIGLGVLAVAAVASYFVFFEDTTSNGGGSDAAVLDTSPPEEDTNQGEGEDQADKGDKEGGKGREDDAPTPRELEEVENLIATWHQAANEGDFETMWQLLSARKKTQITNNRYGAPDSSGSRTANYPDGRASWETAQEDFIGDLDASDVEVSYERPSYPDEDVLTIQVENMFKGSCPWEGITWVRREGGKWYYEPGYLVSPERADDWRYILDSKEGLGDRCSG